MLYNFNMQNLLALTMQHSSWFYRRLTAHAAMISHFHVHHTPLWGRWVMLHTNQKSERCDRWNNAVIILPLTHNSVSNLRHLHKARSPCPFIHLVCLYPFIHSFIHLSLKSEHTEMTHIFKFGVTFSFLPRISLSPMSISHCLKIIMFKFSSVSK